MISALIILSIVVIILATHLYRANKKIQQYKTRIQKLTDIQNRFHDIYFLKSFSWFYTPFYDYVRLGGRRIEDVLADMRILYEEDKQKTINNYIATNSLMKIQKDQISAKRN